ncbi:Peptidyl-prolyl cis-trans isomerase FKBP53 [Platanthera zijinensis]|uniref:FK506-binding protein n=1 Tax=Platanthera zijinensis TaxID=2320716 RepID=A0AAP0B9R0_9ASPA
MTFWGVEIRPGKPYIHSFDQSRGRLRISQATLGDGNSESKSTGQCIVGNSSPVLLCTLIPNVSETCHLELEFEEDKEVTFSVLGPRSIHLTGYYPGHVGRLNGDDSESYGEDISESDTSDSCSDGSEDEYESDFIDDDDDLVYANFPGKKSSGILIEEIKDDDKSCDKNHIASPKEKKHAVSDSEDAETGSSSSCDEQRSTKVESEDEDGFPIFFTKKNKKKSCDSDMNHVTSVKEKADLIDGVDSQPGSQSNKTRTYPNGLMVEEVSMGKPEGKKATPGKKVSMHYIGKLKNGTIFDSNIGQRPFKFRLGIGEVIKGWDLGVNGMRVGDKRRLTIPPSFGYGAKNMGKIPSNSWLLFDVELVDVQ